MNGPKRNDTKTKLTGERVANDRRGECRIAPKKLSFNSLPRFTHKG